jgi:hypothetical protein
MSVSSATLALLKLLGYGRALALQCGIGKSDGGIGQRSEAHDPTLKGCIAGDRQDAAVAFFGDLKRGHQALVLHPP